MQNPTDNKNSPVERPSFHNRMSLLGEMGRRSTMKAPVMKTSEILSNQSLHDAIKSNDIDLVHRCLLQGISCDDKAGVKETAIFAAIRHNRKDIFELLVRNGADINQKNDKDRSCLHEVIRKGRYDMVEILIRTPGIKLDVTSKSGKTPLHLAVITRKRDVVKSLLSNGANPNVCCTNGRSPLHWAAINGDKETANLLLTAGANINERTKHMTTPLIFASHNRGDEIVELLVFREATIGGENADGDTALKLVASHGNVKLLTYMLDQMIEQVRPNLSRIILEITKIKDHIDKLDEISVFRYIYAKLCAEGSFEEEIGFEIIQILHSPIKFLNWLLKEDKELGESNLTKLLEKRFRSDTQERTVLRFLLRLDFCIRKCAEKHEVEYKSLMELVYKVELAINRIFEGDHMDMNINMWKLLMPFDDHNYSEDDKLLGYARCFQEDNMINFCLSNQLKILFDKPQIANIVQKLFRTSLREAVLPEKIESSFNLKSYRIRRSLNLRSCPAANYFLGLVTKTMAIFFTGWISISAYGNNFGTDYNLSGEDIIVYGSEIWFIVFLMGQIVHEIGELADSNFSVSDYLQDEWNYFDIVEYLLCFLWLVLRFIPGQFSNARICLALAAIPQCQGLLRYLSFYKPVGELLIILKAMFSDLSIFLGIYVLMFIGFGITFDGLFHRVKNSTFGSITDTFLSLFSFTMQNFEFDGIFTTSSTAVNTVGPILQICFVVMTSIVLLNLLIARMTNSHQRISNQALREWSFSQAKTVSNLLLWKEKNGMSMLPPPFNLISAIFALIDHYYMVKWDDGDNSSPMMDKIYVSLAGTVSNAILTMTVGSVLRFFHRLHRLLKRMRSRTNSFSYGQRFYILLQIMFTVLWYPIYDWLYLFREYEVHLLDRMNEDGILIYDKLPPNIVKRLEYHNSSEKRLPFQRKVSIRLTAGDASESAKPQDGESTRKPAGKFTKSIDRIQPNKYLRSTSKFYVGHNNNDNASSAYSMGYSLYSIGGTSSKSDGFSPPPKEGNRFSISRFQSFFVSPGEGGKGRRRTRNTEDDEGDEDDDDDDSHHGDFGYGEGREDYGVGFRDLFQEKRVDDGELLEYESSSDEEDKDQRQPRLLPFEQRRLEGKLLRKPQLQAQSSSNSASFFQELEKGTFNRGLDNSNDSGDEIGEAKQEDEFSMMQRNSDTETTLSGYESGAGGVGALPPPSPNKIRLSQARVMLASSTGGHSSESEGEAITDSGLTSINHFNGNNHAINNTSIMMRPPQHQQKKRLLRKPFAAKLGSVQSMSSPSFYQASVNNMNNTSSVFNLAEPVPSVAMGRPPGSAAKTPIAATPLATSTAQRFASHFSVLDHQMWIMEDDKSKIFSPDDVEDILRIFLPSWCEKREETVGRTLSRSYSNLNDDDDRSWEGGIRPTSKYRRTAFGGRGPSPMMSSRNLTPQFGDSMRFTFPSSQNIGAERDKEQTMVAIKEMKTELKEIKSLFEALNLRSNVQTVTAQSPMMTSTTPTATGRSHSRSVDFSNSGVIQSSIQQHSTANMKHPSPRISFHSNANRPAGSNNNPPPGLPATRSEMMRNMRVDSQSTFGYIPMVPSSDDMPSQSFPDGSLVGSTAKNPFSLHGSSSNNIGIGALHSSSMSSYPSFNLPTVSSNDLDEHQVSSSLSRSTDGPFPLREPFVRPTSNNISMDNIVNPEVVPDKTFQDVNQTTQIQGQPNSHSLTALQGELRHMQREVRSVVSHMHQMQTDMSQILRILVSNSYAPVGPGVGSDPHLHASLQNFPNGNHQQQHMMFSSHESPISASVSQSFSVSDLAGIYRETGRNNVHDEFNPVRALVSGKKSSPSPTTCVVAVSTPSATTLDPATATKPPASNSQILPPATINQYDDFDPHSSFLLHSPCVKLSSPHPSGRFTNPSASSSMETSALVSTEAGEVTGKVFAKEDGLKDEEIVASEKISDDLGLEPGMWAVDATYLSSKSSKGTQRVRISTEIEQKEHATIPMPHENIALSTDNGDDASRASDVLAGESLLYQETGPTLGQLLLREEIGETLSSEIDDKDNEEGNMHVFDDDVYRAQLVSHTSQRRPTFTGDHFWMSDSNDGDVSNVNAKDGFVNDHQHENINSDDNDEDEEEEEEGVFSLSRSLYEFAPHGPHRETQSDSNLNEINNATAIEPSNVPTSQERAGFMVDQSLSAVSQRPTYSKEASTMLNDMFSLTRTSSASSGDDAERK